MFCERTTKVLTSEYSITREELIQFVREKYKIEKMDTADAWVWVPGGGDWSNSRLDIDVDTPLNVTIQVTEVTEVRG